MRDDQLGIYCVEDKKFYYLETGEVYVANTIDRIKKALVKRNLIDFNPSTFMDTNKYNIETCKEAKVKNYEIVPVFISKHIETVFNSKDTEKEKKSNRWG